MKVNDFKYECTIHNDKSVILIQFEFEKTKVDVVRALVGSKWSSSKKSWYVLDNEHFRKLFNLSSVEVESNLPKDVT